MTLAQRMQAFLQQGFANPLGWMGELRGG